MAIGFSTIVDNGVHATSSTRGGATVRYGATYKGFSSFEYELSGQFRLNNIELVKLDLLNHIFTRRGERIMMPTFGTSIPDLTFEPLDADLVAEVEDQLTFVFDYDPRVEIVEIVSAPDFENSSLVVMCKLFYIELDITDILDLSIEFSQL